MRDEKYGEMKKEEKKRGGSGGRGVYIGRKSTIEEGALLPVWEGTMGDNGITPLFIVMSGDTSPVGCLYMLRG